MVKAVRVYKPGGPGVIRFEDVDLGAPGPRQIRVRNTAIGVNFADTSTRKGGHGATFPSGLGVEGAGVVERVGDQVTNLRAGDRVVYGSAPGSYAEALLTHYRAAFKIPDGVSDEDAAATFAKGRTVHYLVYSTFPLQGGENVLHHAAAGGVGLLLSQWARALGARVIGTVGSAQKVDLAKARGCDHVLIAGQDDIAARVREITDGKGVDVVYDSVGADTYQASLDSLAPRGMLVSFGAASGPLPMIDPDDLSKRGSLFFTRSGFADYARSRDELNWRSEETLNAVRDGTLKADIGQRYALADAAQAHIDLEARKSKGATILIP